MGLDVYLERCDNVAEADRLEDEFERRSEEMWESAGGYGNLTEQQKDDTRAKIDVLKQEMGLEGWGKHPGRDRVEEKSVKHPDHYFNLGYYRSSYNGSGYNSVMRELGIPDLYHIFGPDDRYRFTPDWRQALERANDALAKLREYADGPRGKYMAMDVNEYDRTITSKKDALDLFFQELDTERPPDFRAYSNRGGTFYPDGIKVHAFVPGKNCIGSPCMYVIVEAPDRLKWYIEALEIVIESIEYVLAQPDPDKHYLVWSS